MKLLLLVPGLVILLSCNNAGKNAERKENHSWQGNWERNDWARKASLDITKVTGDSLLFKIFASSGGNTGDLEGKAFIKGDTAIYYFEEPDDDCLLSFVIFRDSFITVNQAKGFCNTGLGVDYSGKYLNAKYISRAKSEKEENEKTLFDLGTFDNRMEDSIFKNLVNKDYDLFLNSTQLTAENDDLDGLHATVKSSGIEGLFTLMENIIMIDSSKNIWAAVIDDEKVLYYTNSKEYKNRLPKTIEDWRARFKDYPVIYKTE
jgi:hypothetical protein